MKDGGDVKSPILDKAQTMCLLKNLGHFIVTRVITCTPMKTMVSKQKTIQNEGQRKSIKQMKNTIGV
jgi:hypothetical protein